MNQPDLGFAMDVISYCVTYVSLDMWLGQMVVSLLEMPAAYRDTLSVGLEKTTRTSKTDLAAQGW